MNNKTKDVIIVGLALFAMFFGAGNLIFPPFLGLTAGTDWITCGAGFFITAIGFPLLGVIAVAKGGSIDKIGNKVSPLFSKIFGTIVVLSIGPLLAIPRTGATAYELGIQPIYPQISALMISIIFFGLTLIFVIKPSSVVDKIAKILTPLLLIMILAIIFKGLFNPIGTPSSSMGSNAFSVGFSEGYQTMDAIASLVFAGVVLSTVIAKGYSSIRDQVDITIKAGVIAAAFLIIIYGGLIYLGASANNVYSADITKAQLLSSITTDVLGDFGKIALGIVAFLACLTTSIGLTATVGDFFNRLSKDKVPYSLIVIVTCVFSCFVANRGVETIVKVAVPLLVTVYPVAIVLILLNVVGSLIPDSFYGGAVTGAFLISLYDGMNAAGYNYDVVTNILNKIPLYSAGFGWILPSLVGGIITLMIFGRNRSGRMFN